MTSLRLVVAVACLLFASGHTTAQSPPVPDSGKRLQAFEEKLDRVQQMLEGRTQFKVLDPAAIQKQLELMKQAQETLVTKVETQQQAYYDWRVRNHHPLGQIQGGATLFIRQIERDDARIHDLKQRQADVAARLTLVKNVGESEKDSRALLVLLQRRGVDLAGLRQSAGPDAGDPRALVQLYATSLRLEADELDQLVAKAEEQRDRDEKTAQS